MTPPTSLIASREALRTWLARDAFPMWWEVGADRLEGGYFDAIGLDGRAIAGPKRARVQARQIVCYSAAETFGWPGPWREAMSHGWRFLQLAHRRADGLYRAFAGDEQDHVDLYDQAFVLLALAHMHRAEEPTARDTAQSLVARLPRPAEGGFSGLDGAAPASNPNMHLFEAALAWIEAGGGTDWVEIARGQARLAMTRLIDPATGALGELFETGWRAPASPLGQRVEPGHQFEWAWLLMRWCMFEGDAGALATALRLIDLGERSGVEPSGGVTINALDGRLEPIDLAARLWPQTERLRATLLAARIAGEASLWSSASQAAAVMARYLDMDIAGLWRDQLTADGEFVVEPAKASSFYHIVGAALELDKSLA